MKEWEDFNRRPNRWVGCPIEAEYFGEERKSSKAERKLASAKDRSKYKKTDQKKLSKQSPQLKYDANSETLLKGRVLNINSLGICVEVEKEVVYCTLRGVLKKDKTQAKNLVTVGDIVLLERVSEKEGQIVHIEPRSSLLSRADNLSRRKEQLIAANIDQVIITASVVAPLLKPSLVDRYIIAAQKGGMDPIVVVNKVDLLNDKTIDAEVQEYQKLLYQEFLEAYKRANIPVISVSVTSGEGIEDLKKIMQGKASVFSGQSGVGKSSLIGIVTGQDLRVGKIVDRTNKGTHTTTMAQLIPLEFGGWCVDTPGIKSFGIWDLEQQEIEHYFSEIFRMGRSCKFPDCSHISEEDCAVIEGVDKGLISPLRYESYLSLLTSLKQEHLRR